MNFPTAVFRLVVIFMLSFSLPATAADPPGPVRWWMSSVDGRHQLTEQPALTWRASRSDKGEVIEVDDDTTCQTMLGMGSSLEPSTCWNLSRLAPADRDRVMERLVDPARGAGMNLMRICIGTPDFTGDPWYSYDDLPPGSIDLRLAQFSIEKDRAYILPILKLARQKNPNLLFFASPWSPPAWMKDGGTLAGGKLWQRYFPVYAEYFVRFIQAYEAEGIPIHAVTVQNEPGVDRATEKNPKWHYPSCKWTGEEERDFIRDHLGPAFRRQGLKTEIWCYDHNYNVKPGVADDPGLNYPRTVLRDPAAAAFVSGVAFHGYVGDPSGMSVFHSEFPQVPLHFTEGSVFGVRGGADLVQRLRNWASSYNAWVTLLDEKGKPNNGPFEASRTLITLNPQTLSVTEHFDYFLYSQFMKFVARGAVRVQSTELRKPLADVAFRNPDGGLTVIVVNTAKKPAWIRLAWRTSHAEATLSEESVATFVWPGQ